MNPLELTSISEDVKTRAAADVATTTAVVVAVMRFEEDVVEDHDVVVDLSLDFGWIRLSKRHILFIHSLIPIHCSHVVSGGAISL